MDLDDEKVDIDVQDIEKVFGIVETPTNSTSSIITPRSDTHFTVRTSKNS